MSKSTEKCPFCTENNLLRVKILHEEDLWYIADMEEGSINNAVMAITRRHVETPFQLNTNEWMALHSILNKMKKLVDNKEKSDGYNLGWNIHKTGGQNVSHAHLHLLGRYQDEPYAGKGIRYTFKQPENIRTSSKIKR